MSHPHPDTLRLFSDPAYRRPDPSDVKAVVDLLVDYTENDVAAVVGVSDGRCVRRWIAAATAKNRIQISYAAWRLMLLEAGLVRAPKPRKTTRKTLEPAQGA